MQYATANYHHTRQMEESDLLPASHVCPWCGSDHTEKLALLQSSPDVVLLECGQCHAISASRMPTADALGKYYSTYYVGKSYENSAKVTLGKPKRMGRRLSSLAREAGVSATNGEINILDFGGGDGTLSILTAEELLKDGMAQRMSVSVVDYCKDHAPSPDPRITVKFFPTLADLDAPSYQMVIASGVVEHIPEGPKALAEALSKVQPGGMFYARTPQMGSFVRLSSKLNMKWDFTFPAHVYDLGQDFWEGYFSSDSMKKRFEIVASRPSLVEASFSDSPLLATLSFLFKAPWHLLGRHWGFVGGWEIATKARAAA
jgi:hypothetical protein